MTELEKSTYDLWTSVSVFIRAVWLDKYTYGYRAGDIFFCSDAKRKKPIVVIVRIFTVLFGRRPQICRCPFPAVSMPLGQTHTIIHVLRGRAHSFPWVWQLVQTSFRQYQCVCLNWLFVNKQNSSSECCCVPCTVRAQLSLRSWYISCSFKLLLPQSAVCTAAKDSTQEEEHRRAEDGEQGAVHRVRKNCKEMYPEARAKL